MAVTTTCPSKRSPQLRRSSTSRNTTTPSASVPITPASKRSPSSSWPATWDSLSPVFSRSGLRLSREALSTYLALTLVPAGTPPPRRVKTGRGVLPPPEDNKPFAPPPVVGPGHHPRDG